MPINPDIKLNDTESKIVSTLNSFCAEYNKGIDPEHQLELRITGGWVRDRLLGVESHDIDIAINHLSGEEFANQLQVYLAAQKLYDTVRAIHTIKKNPEKSKHLETCTTKLFGLDIDFVNLRLEKYTQDSRVPIIECGTAEEDALRRDATLNALFYNLTTGVIEDLTRRGLQDLENGILRTPLEPLQTFLDDPLRVLRLIRFASRYGFSIDPETLASMRHPDLNNALAHKISRERVLVEWEKTVCSENPGYGLLLLNYTRLIGSILNMGDLSNIVEKLNGPEVMKRIETCSMNVPTQILQSATLYPVFKNYLTGNACTEPKLRAIWKVMTDSAGSQKAFWNSLVLSPYGSLAVRTNPKKNTTMSVVEMLMREGLKASKSDIEKAAVLTAQHADHQSILERYFESPTSVTRSELGLYLRAYGSFSPLGVMFNLFSECLPHTPEGDDSDAPEPTHRLRSEDELRLLQVVKTACAKYEALMNGIEQLGLNDAHLIKPILDGKALSTGLGMKPGPWMSAVNTQMMVWQLDHPSATADDAHDYARLIVGNHIPKH